MIEMLSDDAVAAVGGGDGEGLDMVSDFIDWIKRQLKDPHTDGVMPNDLGLI